MVQRSLGFFTQFILVCYMCIFFSSNTFLHTHISNVMPQMFFTVNNLSIKFSCASNRSLSKALCPLEVNLGQNFTLIILVVTFSYELYFSLGIAHWISFFEFFYLSCRDIMYLGTIYFCGFWLDKMSFRASKSPHKFITLKKKNSYKIDYFTIGKTI
jgi:hypothetical protein